MWQDDVLENEDIPYRVSLFSLSYFIRTPSQAIKSRLVQMQSAYGFAKYIVNFQNIETRLQTCKHLLVTKSKFSAVRYCLKDCLEPNTLSA